jgi:DNA-binding beta-propeller fold protein YncE
MLSLLFRLTKFTNKLVILSTVIALIIFTISFTQYSLAQGKEETDARRSNFNDIKKFDSGGKFITTSWGSEGYGDGVPVEEEEEEEEETENNNNPPIFKSIKKFDSEGKFIASWGSEGYGDGQFLHAHGIDIDSSGNVYVSDDDKNSIQKFDSDGNFITSWGSEGTDDGQFWLPHDIAIDSSDNVYVVDSGNVHEKKEICAI